VSGLLIPFTDRPFCLFSLILVHSYRLVHTVKLSHPPQYPQNSPSVARLFSCCDCFPPLEYRARTTLFFFFFFCPLRPPHFSVSSRRPNFQCHLIVYVLFSPFWPISPLQTSFRGGRLPALSYLLVTGRLLPGCVLTCTCTPSSTSLQSIVLSESTVFFFCHDTKMLSGVQVFLAGPLSVKMISLMGHPPLLFLIVPPPVHGEFLSEIVFFFFFFVCPESSSPPARSSRFE